MSDRLPAVIKVLDRSPATGTTRLVLIAIASFADPDGWNAWPSLRTIAARAGLTSKWADKTVRRCVAALVDASELEVEYKAGPNGCNVYRVLCCAGDVDTQESTSPGDLDLAESTSGSAAAAHHEGPGHPGPETWTPGPTNVGAATPTRGRSCAPQPGEPGSEDQDLDLESSESPSTDELVPFDYDALRAAARASRVAS